MEKLSSEKSEAEDKFKDVYRFFKTFFHDFDMIQKSNFQRQQNSVELGEERLRSPGKGPNYRR